MKHVIYVVTLLFLVVLVGATSFAAKPKVANARVPEELRNYVDQGTINLWRSNMPVTMQKNLADDDLPRRGVPHSSKFIDGSYKSMMQIQMLPTSAAKWSKSVAAPFSGPLSGTYHVGVGKDYATFADAAAALNANGVSGAVTMVLDDNSYPSSNPVVIGTISGASATNTVTFTVKSGTNAAVNFIMFNALPYGIVFSNAHYVTIDGTLLGGTLALGIDEAASTFPTGNQYAGTIGIGNFTDNIAVKNCSITSIADNAVWNNVTDARSDIVVLNTALGTSLITDVTISGNSFGRAYYGVLSTIANGGVGGDGTTAVIEAAATATLQRLKVLNNKFGTNATGLQPCGQAITIGGYSTSGLFIGGQALEVGGNLSDGDQFNNDFEYFATILDEPVTRAGLLGPIDIFVCGDAASSTHDNRDDNYLYKLNTQPGFANFAYAISLRSGSYIGGPQVGYNNLITRMTSSDGTAFMFGTRTEGSHWHHNTSVANGTGGRNIAGRVRSGGNYDNNIFLASSAGGSPRSVALRWEGGKGHGNVIAGTPSFSSTRRLFYQFSSSSQYNNLAYHIATDNSDTSSSDQDPVLTSDADLHPSTVAASGASNLGNPIPSLSPLPKDYDGNTRSATTPDAGAYEFTGVNSTNVNAGVQKLIAPSAAGTPIAVSVVPKVSVSNTSNSAQIVPVTLHIADGFYVDDVQNISLAAHSTGTVSFASWTPPGNGPYTITATTSLGGDGLATDNSVSRSQAIVPLLATYPQNFDFESGNQGWVGTGSWIMDDAADDFGTGNLDGLGGPHGGDFSWVTDDLLGDGAYANATNHQLLSPFFNTLNGPGPADTVLYVNFFHSISTEPNWDRSVFEYSIDTGKTWVVIGGLNDPNGINWYSENPYANAAGDPGCYDGAFPPGPGSGTALTVQWPDASGLFAPSWSSNGNCHGDDLPTGPNGWIFVQIKIPSAAVNKPFVRFRYAAFADASSGSYGWAVDDVQFSRTPNTSTGSVSGKVYADGNASGSHDSYESYLAGVKVRLSGAKVDSTLTAGDGSYSFTGLIAGAYGISVDHGAGTSVTQPYAPNTYSVLFGPGDVFANKDFGIFNGSISGDPYKDNNGNGVKDAGEPGVAGWEIRAYNQSDLYAVKQALAKKDNTTLNSLKVASTTSDGSGNYTLEAKAGTYIIAEVLNSAWKNTEPGVVDTTLLDNGNGTSTTTDVIGFYTNVHIDSLNPTPPGGDFGNFKYGVLTVSSTADLNGNGIRDAFDILSLPFGYTTSFSITKNGVPYQSVLLGNTVATEDVGGLDVGSYVTTETSVSAGLTATIGGGHTTNVFTSGVVDTAFFISFKNINISGKKYNDMNGDGTSSGDPGLAGWKINLTGTSAGLPLSTTTDVNGNYSFTNIGPGVDTVSEVGQAGWMQTAPPAGKYPLVVNVFGSNANNKDFGNFHTVTISGTKYRDRNGDGIKQAGDNGLAGWTINLTGHGSQLTDANGNYAFTNVGPGTDTLTETPQAGYVETAPPSGSYAITTSSGSNVSGRDFGNFFLDDSQQYRSWTYAELSGATEKKPVKQKLGKPITAAPNSANMINDLMSAPKSAVLVVGLSGQTTTGGKEKGWLGPVKQGDVYKTFNNKSIVHNSTLGPAHPLAFYNDGLKRIIKKQKSITPDKANNILLADLLTLKINIAASSSHQTDPGGTFGNLVYCDAGNPLSGMSALAIAVQCDSLMTNWDVLGQPGFTAPIYVLYDTVIAKINAAFSTGLTTDTASYGGWTGPKLRWALKSTAAATAYMCAPSANAVPVVMPTYPPYVAPVVPKSYALLQNYPNPFNPTTTLSFDLPVSATVTIKIYNMLGQEVTTLLNNESFDAGNQEVDFDASALSSGVYFYRIAAKSLNDDGIYTGQTFTQVKKMMLVK